LPALRRQGIFAQGHARQIEELLPLDGPDPFIAAT